VRRLCDLLSVNRSTLYYKEKPPEIDYIDLLNAIRDVWVRYPFCGYRRITKELRANGNSVNRKRVQRLMRDIKITRPNQACMVDITYLRMQNGFMYLVAFIDVYSRYVVGWSLSNTLEIDFCIDALKSGLIIAKPEIVNSDQGCQFTSEDWIDCLREYDIKISMTSKGRCKDNIYIERFWRSLSTFENISFMC